MVCDPSYTAGLGFVLRSFGRIMGCLFRCFCLADDTLQASNHSVSSNNTKDHLVSRNRLASLLLSERDSEESPCTDTKVSSLDSPHQDSIGRELKDQAKFLKSCGTLLETPIEIKKASDKVKGLPANDEHSETSKFHSWLPSTSIEKLCLEGQRNPLSADPIKVHNDFRKESGYPFRPENHVVTDQCKNKCVQFEIETDRAFLRSNKETTKLSNSPGSHNQIKHSPYPTPLKLRDEMQTPGTAYPLYSENPVHGVKARVRSQYVYHVSNPVQNFSQLMALKEEDYNSYEQVHSQRESLEQSEISTPERSSVSCTGREDTSGKEAVDASLSHWLKHSSSSKNDGVQKCVSAPSGSSKTSDLDRPILGTVAAHWNDEEPTHISPKWWDGNGIPNSTNKYKEDQKVSWHATTFEERLEKALSNEGLLSQGKLATESTEFAKNEEGDTAMSRFKVSNHPESVVSF